MCVDKNEYGVRHHKQGSQLTVCNWIFYRESCQEFQLAEASTGVMWGTYIPDVDSPTSCDDGEAVRVGDLNSR